MIDEKKAPGRRSSEPQGKSSLEVTSANEKPQPGKLPPGVHPGFDKLPSEVGVYRCRLLRVIRKRDPKHADFTGILQLTGSKARIFVWIHVDGSLGLRLAKIQERKEAK
jgi:hypothetical protein